MTLDIQRRRLLIAAVLIMCVWIASVSIAGVWTVRAAIPRLLNHSFRSQHSTIIGELVESNCWATQGSYGVAHHDCAMNCAKLGNPVAVVDRRTRMAFVLLPNRGQASLPPKLIEALGHEVTIHGEVYTRGGIQFALVHSWQRLR
jgi:hypothetical protein